MATSRERAAIAGYLGFAAVVATIGFWIVNTGPTTAPPNYQSPPAQTQETWSPDPLHTEAIASPYGPDRDCGDGTTGTFAECWARIKAEASQEVRDAEASRPQQRDAMPPLPRGRHPH